MIWVRRAVAAAGWTVAFCVAFATAVAVSSASILYMQAGLYGLRQFGVWWWWNYLSVRTPGAADKMQNSFLFGVGAFGLVMLAAWIVARRFRQTRQVQRPLYGKTEPASRPEMQESGLALKRKL